MQHKLKSILHSASKRRSSSPEYREETARYHDESSPYTTEQAASTTGQPQSSNRDSRQSGRSQPVLAVHDNLRRDDAPSLTGYSNTRYEENVADRNIDQYSPTSYSQRERSLQQNGPAQTTLPHRGVPSRGKDHLERTISPTRTARNEHEPRLLQTDNSSRQIHPEKSVARQNAAVMSQEHSAGAPAPFAGSLHEMDGVHTRGGTEDWRSRQRSLLDGVVDLNNTVDTDKVTHIAPAVTHEVIKRHEHEIIQHRIYREIHNYSYYHRLQPVLQTEVLPPRHFIPNPKGDGLIEISADEVPARTGKNRWWDIVQREVSPPSIPNNSHRWRTEPESIEGAPYITEEGFERRETTTVYPPTLEDLSTYSGVVQPVHFDHETGERWLGDITTMDKLREGMQHLSHQENGNVLPPSPTIKRKPVNGSNGEEAVPRLGVTA